MQRSSLSFLHKWFTSSDRKPLVIRGARQVGKTWLARQLAATAKLQLIELNLEKQPELASLFTSNDPQQILLNLSAAYNLTIDPAQCLLLIDEIQAAPELFSKLRWFAEDLPELAVIATGSLLDFILAEHTFSMPVGRVSYLYLEPLSFDEFLLAQDQKNLYNYLTVYDFNKTIPIALHHQLMTLFKEYIIIGGLPAAVANWIIERSLSKVNQIHYDLLATYREDFFKYRGRVLVNKLDEVMMAIPKMLGQKFVCSRINPALPTSAVKHILDLLHKARICHPIMSCGANGVPLAADMNEKFFKEIFLDIGLVCAALGLNYDQVSTVNELTLVNNGAIAEQVAGQLLRTLNSFYIEPALYYWQRMEKNANAEVDYVIQHASQVIPIEVKAGSTGSLKSLHMLMGLKKLEMAIRVNSEIPSKMPIIVKGYAGEAINYTLLSIPFYLISQIHRLLK